VPNGDSNTLTREELSHASQKLKIRDVSLSEEQKKICKRRKFQNQKERITNPSNIKYSFWLIMSIASEISGSHGGEYEDDWFLVCCAVSSGRSLPKLKITSEMSVNVERQQRSRRL
jgi:hypothetical protein